MSSIIHVYKIHVSDKPALATLQYEKSFKNLKEAEEYIEYMKKSFLSKLEPVHLFTCIPDKNIISSILPNHKYNEQIIIPDNPVLYG